MVAFLFLILISNVTASFQVGNKSSGLDLIYGSNEDTRGWINMSFNHEPLTSKFEDSEDNTINLFDLLKSDSRLFQGTEYSCNPIANPFGTICHSLQELLNCELYFQITHLFPRYPLAYLS